MSNLMLTKNGNIVKRNPTGLGNFPAWTSFIDELFNDQLDYVKNSNDQRVEFSPKVNIKESDDGYSMDIVVPGFKKTDFVIDLDNEILSVSAEVKTEEKHRDDHFTRKEFKLASFKRTFTLPETIEADKIEANYSDGILNLTIPKKEEAKPKPARTITIK